MHYSRLLGEKKMIVCVCNRVNEDKIVETIEEHKIQDIEELREKLNVCNNCCCCQRYIENMISLLKE